MHFKEITTVVTTCQLLEHTHYLCEAALYLVEQDLS